MGKRAYAVLNKPNIVFLSSELRHVSLPREMKTGEQGEQTSENKERARLLMTLPGQGQQEHQPTTTAIVYQVVFVKKSPMLGHVHRISLTLARFDFIPLIGARI
jgi:hypothetical protein